MITPEIMRHIIEQAKDMPMYMQEDYIKEKMREYEPAPKPTYTTKRK